MDFTHGGGYDSFRQYGGILFKYSDDTVKKIDVEFTPSSMQNGCKRNVRMFCHYQFGCVKQKAYYPQQNNDNSTNYNNRNGNYNNSNYNQNERKENNTIILSPMRKCAFFFNVWSKLKIYFYRVSS